MCHVLMHGRECALWSVAHAHALFSHRGLEVPIIDHPGGAVQDVSVGHQTVHGVTWWHGGQGWGASDSCHSCSCG